MLQCASLAQIIAKDKQVTYLAVQVMEEEMGGVMEQQQEVRRALQEVQFSRRLDEQQRQLQQQRLEDAEARLKKARLLVQGPILPKVSFQRVTQLPL